MSAPTRALSSPAEAVIEIVKWKVRKGSKVDPGAVLMLYKFQGEETTRKLKSQQIGSVAEIYKKQGDVVQPNQQLLTLAGCSHNIRIKDMCAECGKDLREEEESSQREHEQLQLTTDNSTVKKKSGFKKATVSMVHSVPELVVTDKHAEEIGQEDLLRLRRNKKLVLLVDLDQTLIHTTTDNVPNKLKMGGVWYHTKFRPGTEQFLQTIAKFYELHVVTFGVRQYAHSITRMMDGAGNFFSHRILSRDEFLDPNTKKANLKSLFPCGDDMVAIIDDREDVWNYSPNLIPVLPYKFFKATGDINDPSKLKGLKPAENPSDTNDDKNPADDKGDKIIQSSECSKDRQISTDEHSTNQTTPDKDINETEQANSSDTEKSSSVKRNLDDSEESSHTPEEKPQEKKLKSDTVPHDEPAQGDSDSESHHKKLKQSHSEPVIEGSETVSENDTVIPEGTSDSNQTADNTNSSSLSHVTDKTAEVSESNTTKQTTETERKTVKSDTSTTEDLKSESMKHTGDHTPDRLCEESKLEDSSDKNAAKSAEGDNMSAEGEGDNKSGEGDNKSAEGEGDNKSAEGDNKAVEGDNKENTAEAEEKEVEWPDDDNYLEKLTDILVDLHHEFYARDNGSDPNLAKLPLDHVMGDLPVLQKVSSVIKYQRKQVLDGCVLAFSGLFPQSVSLYHSTAYHIAISLGAKIAINVEDDVTHLVASRLGTKKVRQASTKETCTIVHPDWLWLSWYNFERQSEIKHLLTSENEVAEPKRGGPPVSQMCGNYDPSFGRKRRVPDSVEVDTEEIRRVKLTDIESEYQMGCDDDTIIVEEGESVDEAVARAESEAKRRFSDSYNPLMTFDNDDITAMDAEIDDATSSESEEDDETSRDKELRKKVLSSDENESDSETESLSNDYPRGWGPKRKSSPHNSDHDQMEEEDLLRLQEDQENSPMEINSSDSDDDDEVAAALDLAFDEDL